MPPACISDGRFIDYSVDKDLWGQAGAFNTTEQNKLHSISISNDGERGYVAGTTAGFYVLNTEAIAHHTDADLAAGTAGCNLHTTQGRHASRHRRGETPRSRQRLRAHGHQR